MDRLGSSSRLHFYEGQDQIHDQEQAHADPEDGEHTNYLARQVRHGWHLSLSEQETLLWIKTLERVHDCKPHDKERNDAVGVRSPNEQGRRDGDAQESQPEDEGNPSPAALQPGTPNDRSGRHNSQQPHSPEALGLGKNKEWVVEVGRREPDPAQDSREDKGDHGAQLDEGVGLQFRTRMMTRLEVSKLARRTSESSAPSAKLRYS